MKNRIIAILMALALLTAYPASVLAERNPPAPPSGASDPGAMATPPAGRGEPPEGGPECMGTPPEGMGTPPDGMGGPGGFGGGSAPGQRVMTAPAKHRYNSSSLGLPSKKNRIS